MSVLVSFTFLLSITVSTRLATVGDGPQAPSVAEEAVAEASRLHFHSSFWMNLHHTLYAAAWSRRPNAGTLRALAGPLPAPLSAPLSTEEQAAWDAAIAYYDREIASRDLLFDEGMRDVKSALVKSDVSGGAVAPGLRSMLERAAPVYRAHFWPAHDRANRDWIKVTADRLRTIAEDTIPLLERLYGHSWFQSAVRVDVVWVGNRQGAYTTLDPTHVTIASSDREHTEWTSVEVVFHEVSHTLVLPLQRQLSRALGERRESHGVLWHVIQFYLTGAAVQQILRSRGIEYTPYMYSTGLLDRAWGRYREPVEANWAPYVNGTITLAEAIERTVAAVTRR